MCQSKAEGGRRCSGTPAGRALSALYRERKSNPARAEELNRTIAAVKEAVTLYGGTFVTPFEMELPQGVHTALDVARRVGNPLIVGGAVRDVTAGVDNKDTDIEVHGASLDRLADAYRSAGFRVDEVGKQFGVLKVSKHGVVSDLDIAVPRRENAVGAGHRDFEVQHDADMTVTDAAERRDFTINAMMFDPRLGVLVDPFNGAEDLKSKTLRAVSDKFAEDPLRVLRGVQFAGRFGLDIDPETALMCKNLRPHYSELAHERVAEEWTKLFTKGVHADAALRVLVATGWDDTLPGLKEAARDESTVRGLSNLGDIPPDYRASAGAAILSRNMPAEHRREFIKRVTVGNDAVRLALALVDTTPVQLSTEYLRKKHARECVKAGWTFAKYRNYAAAAVGDTEGVKIADRALAEGLGDGPEPPLIQGRDVIALTDRKPGPWVGALVDEALDRQYRGFFKDADDAREWARAVLTTQRGL